MSRQETVTVKYMVFCGNPTSDGSVYPFKYIAQAPASLCMPHSRNEPGPDPDATGQFITSLIDAHNDEILRSQAWRCMICDKPAKEILHSAIPLLSPVKESMSPDFEPHVIDTAAPICASGGSCDRKADELVKDYAEGVLRQKPWQVFDRSECCDKCGKKSGVKLCGGCKLLAYCSKECQKQSWPSHKANCKRAQAERAAVNGVTL